MCSKIKGGDGVVGGIDESLVKIVKLNFKNRIEIASRPSRCGCCVGDECGAVEMFTYLLTGRI